MQEVQRASCSSRRNSKALYSISSPTIPRSSLFSPHIFQLFDRKPREGFCPAGSPGELPEGARGIDAVQVQLAFFTRFEVCTRSAQRKCPSAMCNSYPVMEAVGSLSGDIHPRSARVFSVQQLARSKRHLCQYCGKFQRPAACSLGRHQDAEGCSVLDYQSNLAQMNRIMTACTIAAATSPSSLQVAASAHSSASACKTQ